MKVIKSLGGDTIDGISANFKIEDYQEESDSEVLFLGINSTFNPKKEYEDYKRRILLNLWSPCEFTARPNPAGLATEQDNFFSEVYGVCPYTAEWMNNVRDNNKCKFIWHPSPTWYVPSLQNKEYDVCYFGGLHGPDHHECIKNITHFKYRFMSQQRYPEVTNFNVSYKEKMDIVALTKISVCYHFIPTHEQLISNIKTYSRWDENEAFKDVFDGGNKIPQLKARMHEAALCKTLNLVKRDRWNVVEHFYTPDVDFIYFDNSSDLREIIQNVLNNYHKYEKMIESAYNKCLKYGEEGTYNKIKTGGI